MRGDGKALEGFHTYRARSLFWRLPEDDANALAVYRRAQNLAA